MNFKKIKETCIYFKDLNKAKEFYHGLLGLPVIAEVKDKHIFFKAGSSVLLCFNPEDSKSKESPPAHYSEGKYHFAFEVSAEEYQMHKEKMESRGIRITDVLVWKNGLESFYFEDPVGNILEVVPEGVWD